MRRLEFKEIINERLPLIKEQYSKQWEKSEKLRQSFVKAFPVSKISELEFDEYVIGKQSKGSFCYKVEIELDSLGRIKGTNCSKFGVWHGTKKGARRGYQYVNKFGKSAEDAFENVKTEIVNLLVAGQSDDWEAIKNNKISPMYKGKLLYIYYPNKHICVYSKDHLEHFASNLDLDVDGSCIEALRKELFDYRNSFKTLKNESMLCFMRLLYDVFGYPSDSNKEIKVDASDRPIPYPLLGTVTPLFISELPMEKSSKTDTNSGRKGKTDFQKKNKAQKRLGDRGEKIALKAEEKRLKDLGKQGLADKIEHISQDNDSAGYDILSFNEDGTPRHIEVKSTANETICDGFYFTANELTKSQELENYYLYFVLSARSTKPLIYPLAQPDFKENKFTMEPTNYHITIKGETI
ncbi:MAG TPA: DUF3883 domain-containing protein [Sedimentisphaerales bacterium]|nr:DUF3883 domain-containing protein [Sedimentisphaerales bacterium]